MKYKIIFLLAGIISGCILMSLSAQPVRSVPATTPVTKKTSKPVKQKIPVVDKTKDSDQDGVPDVDDWLWSTPGPASNGGAPKFEKGQKVAQKATALTDLINECMMSSSSWSPTEKKYNLTLANGIIQYNIRTDSMTSPGKKINNVDNYFSLDVATIENYRIFYWGQSGLGTPYALVLYGDVTERIEEHVPNERVINLKRDLISIPIKEDCVVEFGVKLMKLLHDMD